MCRSWSAASRSSEAFHLYSGFIDHDGLQAFKGETSAKSFSALPSSSTFLQVRSASDVEGDFEPVNTVVSADLRSFLGDLSLVNVSGLPDIQPGKVLALI